MESAFEPGGIMRQYQVEIGHIDMRLVPVDQRHPLGGRGDGVEGLGRGADDYIATPFGVRELVAHVEKDKDNFKRALDGRIESFLSKQQDSMRAEAR